MSAARTERLLNLLTLLLNSRTPLALRQIRELEEFSAYLTQDLKSGERAFERDKAALLELGVPLRWVAPDSPQDGDDTSGGYVIDKAHYFLPDLHLAPADVALLSIAGAAAAALDGFGDQAVVVRALAKLGFDVEAHSTPMALAHAPLPEGVNKESVGANLAALHRACAERQRIVLTYETSPHQAATERQVDPFGLYYRRGAWYLVGYCHLRSARRTFHLARLRQLKEVGVAQAFVVPADFDLAQHAQMRPWAYPGAPAVAVVIKLAPRLRPALHEIFGNAWRLEQAADGLRIHLQVTHPDALCAAVLPYGAAAQIIAPAALRTRMAQTYQALRRRYEEKPPGVSL